MILRGTYHLFYFTPRNAEHFGDFIVPISGRVIQRIYDPRGHEEKGDVHLYVELFNRVEVMFFKDHLILRIDIKAFATRSRNVGSADPPNRRTASS